MRLVRAISIAGAACVCVLAWSLAHEPVAETVQAAPPRVTTTREYDAVQAELLEQLTLWREDDPRADRDRLVKLADEFARDHGRNDAPRVVAHYLALSPDERRIGLADEARWAELWRATKDADPASWTAERPGLLRELRLFADEVLPRKDDLPAALALSLAARIEVRALESRKDSPAERDARLERAQADARRALAICERAGSTSRGLEARWTLARLDRLRGRAGDAETAYARLAADARLLRNDAFLQHALVARIDLARDRGDVFGIDALLSELAELRSPEECWPLASAAAGRLLDEDRPERAEEFLLRNRPQGDAEQDAWRVLLILAQLRQGETSRARAQLAALSPNHPDARLLEGQLLLAEDRPWEVVALWQAPTSREFLAPLARVVAATQLGEAWLAEDEPQRAAEILDEALAEAEDWEARLARDRQLATGTGSVAGEWLGLHAVVLATEARLRSGDELGALVRAEAWHARGLRGASLDADDLLAWAAGDELGLLSISIGADRGIALHLAADGTLEALEIRHPRRALREGVRRLREAARRDDEEAVRELGAELARHLLPPRLHAQLASGDPDRRLLLLAHGPLEALPFELLVLDDGAWLDERASPHHLPGLPARRPGVAEPLDGPWDLLGDPRRPDGEPLFPSARAELEAIRALRPDARVFAREAFDRDAVLEALASPSPVHLATHLGPSAQCAHPRYAPLGLALDAGAELCVGELADAPLASRLVVLSACESAGGRDLDAEGLQGLSRILLEAGVHDLLVSPWPIRDRAAAAFTPAFHAALLTGATPARAARLARTSLREGGWPVSDWSSFRLLGR
ncbi:MAG: CHAT domain-containing protein [Planctomycetes bacterium]|nr:CHAT domain-containing protein [Planctomycetota bacterium]MCB9903240.1 CHAT domain-containing protein [Planctomycetota bacterium]